MSSRKSVSAVRWFSQEGSSIKDRWAYHFPKRFESEPDRAALLALIGAIKQNSGASNLADTATAVVRFGIPVGEWAQFEIELIISRELNRLKWR